VALLDARGGGRGPLGHTHRSPPPPRLCELKEGPQPAWRVPEEKLVNGQRPPRKLLAEVVRKDLAEATIVLVEGPGHRPSPHREAIVLREPHAQDFAPPAPRVSEAALRRECRLKRTPLYGWHHDSGAGLAHDPGVKLSTFAAARARASGPLTYVSVRAEEAYGFNVLTPGKASRPRGVALSVLGAASLTRGGKTNLRYSSCQARSSCQRPCLLN
jgi:hypothetical protein